MNVISFPAAPAVQETRGGRGLDLADAYDYLQIAVWLGITVALPFISF